jgi:hypothetical protein
MLLVTQTYSVESHDAVNNEMEKTSKEEVLGYFKLRNFQITTLRICLQKWAGLD